MNESVQGIDEKLKFAPALPGVYVLKDRQGRILYVGKAKSLRNRLRSHFRPGKNEDIRHRRLMSQVADFETIVVDSEVEALILEANFVKEHHPKYNVNLKDDKSYPFIRVTRELYPRVFITRKAVQDGSAYFGPYTDVKILRQLMSAVRSIFPLRTCGLSITPEAIERKKFKVCLNYHIGRCRGPCEGRISPSEYGRMVDQVVAFIKGKNQDLAAELEARMKDLSRKRQFEEAAVVRDELRALSRFLSRQKIVDTRRVNRDILSLALSGRQGCAMVFDVREGKMTNRRHFYLINDGNASEKEVLAAFIKQVYLKADVIPDEILLPWEPEEIIQLNRWLNSKKESAVRITIPCKGQKKKLVEMCLRNARLLLEELLEQKEKRKQRIHASVLALQNDLGLKKPPCRIEAFDVSNTAGSDSVASLVVFENGRPKKSDYRYFKIKTVQGIDDFKMMAEAVERRIARLQREDRPLPDLILVDGGKGQLSAAVSVLTRMGLSDQPVAGLAKRLEEIFIPWADDAQTLPRSSPGLKLLQQVRDEAHRFAVTFHRKLRGKRLVRSALDEIP
ncbi:MAG TPA: excinuclease ABC subunit C, partial [bacterium]|nr:excinuclease ABC subunit C [bacterium]